MMPTAREILAGPQNEPVVLCETLLGNTAPQEQLYMDLNAGQLPHGGINRDVELLSNSLTKLSDGRTKGAGKVYDIILSGLQLNRSVGRDFGVPELPGLGKIKIGIRDGNQAPDLHKRSFTGAVFTVKVGGKVDGKVIDYRDYPTLFTGHNKKPSGPVDTLLVGLEGVPLSLFSLFPLNTYSGLGGREGTADMIGQAKPFCVGSINNATPDDLGGGLYLYHDGISRGLTAARKKDGTPLTISQKSTDEVLSGSVPAANTVHYSLDGFLKVDPASVDQLTVDHDGADFTPGANQTVDNIAGIFAYLLEMVTGGEVSLNHPSSSWDIGWLFKERKPLIKHLHEIAAKCGYDVLHNDDDTLTLKRRYNGQPIDFDGTANALSDIQLNEQNIIETSINQQPALPVVEQLVIGYRKNWTPTDGDQLLSSYKKELSREADWASESSGSVAESGESKIDEPLVTPLVNQADADQLASIAGYMGSERVPFTINVKEIAWLVREGDLLPVDHFRFIHEKFLVLSVSEDTKTRITTLTGLNVL